MLTFCVYSLSEIRHKRHFQHTQGKLQTEKKQKEEFRKHIEDHVGSRRNEWTSGFLAHRAMSKQGIKHYIFS